MKKMMSFEVKKLLDKKVIVIIFVLFMMNIGYNVFNHYQEISSDFFQGKKQIVHIVEGQITQEKVDFLSSELQKYNEIVESGQYDTENKDENLYTGYVYGDMNAFDEVYTDVKKTYEYSQLIGNKLTIIDENIERSGQTNDYSLMIKSKLQGRYISSYYDTQGLEEYFHYSYSFLFILIIVILAGVQYLYYDRKYDMESLIDITKIGKQKKKKTRFCIMTCFTLLVSLAFFLSDLICFCIMYDIKGFMNPIYSISSFYMSYFKVPVFLIIIFIIILKLLGLLLVNCIMLFSASKFKWGYLTILMSFVIAIIVWINLYTMNDSVCSIINILSTFQMHKIGSFYIHDIYFILIGLCMMIGSMSCLYLRKGKI